MLPRTACLSAIQEWFDKSFGSGLLPSALLGADREYSEISREQVAALVSEDLVADSGRMLDPNLYGVDRYDCEDFALAARALVAHRMRIASPAAPPPAFGLLYTGMHTLNIGVTSVNGAAVPYLLDVHFVRHVQRGEGNLVGFMDDVIARNWLLPINVRFVLL
jgi:hypothetical protein